MKPIILLFLFLVLTLVPGFKTTRLEVSDSQSIVNAHANYLTTDHKGNLVMSWVKGSIEEESIVAFAISTDKGKTFAQKIEVPATKGVSTAHGECPPKIAFKKDGTIYILFRVDEPTDENFYAGDIYVVTSADGGKSWSPRKRVTRTTGYSRGFFDVKTMADGEIGAIWLESRAANDTVSIGSTIKFAKTTGQIDFAKEKTISENVCQCCKTKLYIAKNKGIHVVFRKIFEDGSRDMAHTFSMDNGQHFSQAKNVNPDNWKINGCPHVGPDMVASGKDLHVVWFTMGGKGGISTASSADNGQSFTTATTLAGTKASHPQISALPDGSLAVVWDESCEKEGKLEKKIGLQTFHGTGKGETIYLTQKTNVVHPVISAVDENNLFVAYTEKVENGKKITFQIVKVKQ